MSPMDSERRVSLSERDKNAKIAVRAGKSILSPAENLSINFRATQTCDTRLHLQNHGLNSPNRNCTEMTTSLQSPQSMQLPFFQNESNRRTSQLSTFDQLLSTDQVLFRTMLVVFDVPLALATGNLLTCSHNTFSPCVFTVGKNFFSVHSSGRCILEVRYEHIVDLSQLEYCTSTIEGEVSTTGGFVKFVCPAECQESTETFIIFYAILGMRIRSCSSHEEGLWALRQNLRIPRPDNVRLSTDHLIKRDINTNSTGVPLLHNENPIFSILSQVQCSPENDQYGRCILGETFSDVLFTPSIMRSWLEQYLKCNVRFARLSQLYPKGQLFQNDSITLANVDPGWLNTSWIILLVHIAVDRAYIDFKSQFEPNLCNSMGVYSLRFHIGGAWQYVLVDDTIPVMEGKKSILPISSDKELWLPILVKSIAKYHGTYEAVNFDENISPGILLCDLTGGVLLATMYSNSDTMKNSILLRGHFEAGDVLLVMTGENSNALLPSRSVFVVSDIDAPTGQIILSSMNQNFTSNLTELGRYPLRIEIVRFFTSWNEASLAGTLNISEHPLWFSIVIPDKMHSTTTSTNLFITVRKRDPRIPHEDERGASNVDDGKIRIVLATDGSTTSATGSGDLLEPINVCAKVTSGVHMLELSLSRRPRSDDALKKDLTSMHNPCLTYTLRVLCTLPFSLEQKIT